MVLDFGFGAYQFKQTIQPFIFAISFTICIFYPNFRKYNIITALILLTLMIFIYLLNSIEISNWFGSLGFGMLFIAIISYLPQIIKKGSIEKY